MSSVVDGYHAGHVVMLTSISEGFPYTLIEAMATGRATVATHVGGVKDGGNAGLVVPPRDHHAIAGQHPVAFCETPSSAEPSARPPGNGFCPFSPVEQSMALFADVYREVTGRPASAIVVDHQQHPGRSDPDLVAPESDVQSGDPIALDHPGGGRPPARDRGAGGAMSDQPTSTVTRGTASRVR